MNTAVSYYVHLPHALNLSPTPFPVGYKKSNSINKVIQMKPRSGIVSPPGTVRSSISNILDQLNLLPRAAVIQSSSSFIEMRITYWFCQSFLLPWPTSHSGHLPGKLYQQGILGELNSLCPTLQSWTSAGQLRWALRYTKWTDQAGLTLAQGLGHQAPLHPTDMPSRIW